MASICEMGIARGVREIAFTEHMDFIPEEPNTGYFDYDSYMRKIERCRAALGDRIEVLAAIEVDYCPDFEDEIDRWLDGKEFDFVVGSVHYLRGQGNISEPRAADYFVGKDVRQAYAEYFDAVRKSAQFGRWDALGHLDLVKRYGVATYGAFDVEPFAGVIDDILRAVIDSGMSLEINTSGLRQGPREAYPCPDILRRYRELGGWRLTVGSDSHTERHVGAGIEEALKSAMKLGFTSIQRYRGRAGESAPIAGAVDMV